MADPRDLGECDRNSYQHEGVERGGVQPVEVDAVSGQKDETVPDSWGKRTGSKAEPNAAKALHPIKAKSDALCVGEGYTTQLGQDDESRRRIECEGRRIGPTVGAGSSPNGTRPGTSGRARAT